MEPSNNAIPLNDVGSTPTPPSSEGCRLPSLATDHNVLLKDLHGRDFQTVNKFYLLPADVDEHARLDIQHQMMKAKLEGLYSSDHVRRILAPRGEGREPPAILDIGTGSGSWALDMAEEFPHAEVVGVDLVPPNVARPPPPNCRFECVDVNQGLKQYKNKFDVVHARSVFLGIEDVQTFFYQAFDLLRPGGILLVIDGNSIHDENGTILTQLDESAPDFSWVAMLTQTMWQMLKERSEGLGAKVPSVMNARLFQGWMQEMTIWEAQEHQKLLIPVGPWKPNLDERDERASELLRQNFCSICESWRPALLNGGYPTDTVDGWIANARDEIANLKAHTYLGLQASWALKPDIPKSETTAADAT